MMAFLPLPESSCELQFPRQHVACEGVDLGEHLLDHVFRVHAEVVERLVEHDGRDSFVRLELRGARFSLFSSTECKSKDDVNFQ